MENTMQVKPEANQQNIESAINKIKQFAADKGYRITGSLETGVLRFESRSKEKVLRNYLGRVDRKIGMATANRMLHYLYRKVYGFDTAPRVELSEQEIKIQACRKAWKAAHDAAEKLRVEYKAIKGDFYKK